MTDRALTIACPDCAAPPSQPCTVHDAYLVGADDDHATTLHPLRDEQARLVTAEHGTCNLCGQFLLRATDPDEVWHPTGYNLRACPTLPDPITHWNDYATATQNGATPMHPGPEHFVPVPVAPPMPPRIPDADPMRPPT